MAQTMGEAGCDLGYAWDDESDARGAWLLLCAMEIAQLTGTSPEGVKIKIRSKVTDCTCRIQSSCTQFKPR
jgi:hypothetical protein